MKRTNAPYKRRWWLIPVILVIIIVASFAVYVSVFYHADETALRAMNSDETVSVSSTSYGWLFDGPSDTTALIFYPGAKVEETAYAPLLHEIAASGIDVCVVKMPFRMAIFNSAGAEKVMQEHEYEQWYIGGHSLGGAMAASYASGHGDDLTGVILFAAYATKQVPEAMTEIVLVGSEDKVLNWSKLEQGRDLAPIRYSECVIEGGNHAQFGSYGEQSGDGAATISPAEQIAETVKFIQKSI